MGCDDECPICQESLDQCLSVSIPCAIPHRFCLSCVVQLETRTCPLCRCAFDASMRASLGRIPPHVRQALADLLTCDAEQN